jgi:hypothetical protein
MLFGYSNLLVKTYILAQVATCPAPIATAIDIVSETNPVVITHSMAETASKAPSIVTSKLATLSTFAIGRIPIPNTTLTCFSVKKLSVKVVVTPTIYVDEKFPVNSCAYNAYVLRGRQDITYIVSAMNQEISRLKQTLQSDAKERFNFPKPLAPRDMIQAERGLVSGMDALLSAKRKEILRNVDQVYMLQMAQRKQAPIKCSKP